METWSLQHPEYGLIEVRTGFDPEFSQLYEDWPGAENTGVPLHGGSSLAERVRARLKNPPTRVEVLVSGSVQHRYDQLESGRYALFGPGPKNGEFSVMLSFGVDRKKPHLNIVVSPFKEILQVEFREGDRIVEFDPPPGSRGEKRRSAMQSSELKRALIPVAEGLGKGGWALLALVLGPIIARFFTWLGRYVPDWDVPDWSMPRLELPAPDLPHLELPVPKLHLPSLPEMPEMPEWVKWLAEYSQIWVPIIIGVIVGVVALRNHRKSEAQKREWGARDEAPPSVSAQD